MVTVRINNKPRDVAPGATLLTVLQETSTPLQGIAVAVNNKIISQSRWSAVFVEHGDDILVVKATQGG